MRIRERVAVCGSLNHTIDTSSTFGQTAAPWCFPENEECFYVPQNQQLVTMPYVLWHRICCCFETRQHESFKIKQAEKDLDKKEKMIRRC